MGRFLSLVLFSFWVFTDNDGGRGFISQLSRARGVGGGLGFGWSLVGDKRGFGFEDRMRNARFGVPPGYLQKHG